jgi:hypothetical protein
MTRTKLALLAALLAIGLYGGMAFALGGWSDPPGGWDLLVQFDDLLGKDLATEGNAALDGNWNHDNGSDAWDGSAPGDGAPGGVMIEVVPNAGDPSGNAVVLSIEDTGDPRKKGFADPSNRKVYLMREIPTADNIFENGVTFIARWRINPTPKEAPADGYTLHDGAKGQVGIVHAGAVAGDGVNANFSMALDSGGILYFANEGQDPLDVGDEFQFHTVWAIVKANPAGDYDVTIYLDGSDAPVFEGTIPLGDGIESSPNFANYITVGLGSTGRDGAIQVDYIGYKLGVYSPTPAAVSPADKLPTSWGRIKAR